MRYSTWKLELLSNILSVIVVPFPNANDVILIVYVKWIENKEIK